MKKDIKQKIFNEKGITLAALTITVAVMIIIARISIETGTKSISNTRLKGFYSQLEIIQKRVDDIVSTGEGYYVTNGNTKKYVDIQTQTGSAITDDQKAFLQEVLNEEGINTFPLDEFKYYTKEDLENELNLSEMKYNVFIHFNTRTIISDNPLKVDGKEYYILKNNTYFVEQDPNLHKGNITLEYTSVLYGNSNYKITVKPSIVGGLEAIGTLKYKETTTKYWKTADGLDIIVNKLTQYNIEYTDSNKNTVSDTITLSKNDDGDPIVTVNK